MKKGKWELDITLDTWALPLAVSNLSRVFIIHILCFMFCYCKESEEGEE